MTSRGCAWACTFCGAEATWGRGFRGQSVPYVLDAIEAAVAKLPVKMVQIKDDTFTTNSKRVIEICRGIRDRKISFLWSCDTRVDVLGEELLREMRLAGCQRLSLGVESGSPSILKNIDKKITVEKIIESTELAKKYGIQVRYYMMLGNRGETAETFRETLAFLEAARPHQYIFSCLSIYPGTRDFDDAEAAGWLERDVYFRGDFQELKTPFDASEEDTALMNAWFEQNKGLRELYREAVAERRAILERLGDHHAAHMELGVAYLDAGQLDLAERHVARALELGYPLPGLALNALACIAAGRRDWRGDAGLTSRRPRSATRSTPCSSATCRRRARGSRRAGRARGSRSISWRATTSSSWSGRRSRRSRGRCRRTSRRGRRPWRGPRRRARPRRADATWQRARAAPGAAVAPGGAAPSSSGPAGVLPALPRRQQDHGRPGAGPGAGGGSTAPGREDAEPRRALPHAGAAGPRRHAVHARADPAGYPYGSLVAVTVDAHGRPLLLLSALAEHTGNLKVRAEASLLLAEPAEGLADPLALGRMTLIGPCRPPRARRRPPRMSFLAAHPRASYYVDFTGALLSLPARPGVDPLRRRLRPHVLGRGRRLRGRRAGSARRRRRGHPRAHEHRSRRRGPRVRGSSPASRTPPAPR